MNSPQNMSFGFSIFSFKKTSNPLKNSFIFHFLLILFFFSCTNQSSFLSGLLRLTNKKIREMVGVFLKFK
ncbi:hypothetical protein Mgra_00001266 [Meloidogyne graminicola]|uniref:Uncharacterized protein n=1 Tax=Meloidogyne graminicola TaxID=189291 RepID=A0A8T0A1X7_9BILA|nr:hypothetical protein Mgra_00001266 [Meloidogyne graminicola]